MGFGGGFGGENVGENVQHGQTHIDGSMISNDCFQRFCQIWEIMSDFPLNRGSSRFQHHKLFLSLCLRPTVWSGGSNAAPPRPCWPHGAAAPNLQTFAEEESRSCESFARCAECASCELRRGGGWEKSDVMKKEKSRSLVGKSWLKLYHVVSFWI